MRHVVTPLAVLAALGLAACAETPRPFEHDNATSEAFPPKSDKTEVAIATPANMPDQLAERVAAALAVELQAYNIVAAVQPAQAPMKVSGAMSTHDSTSGTGIDIEIEWFLFNGKRIEGPMVSKTHALPEDYAAADDNLASRIAQQAAPQVATLMGRPPTYQARSIGQVALGLSIPPTPPPAAPGTQTASAMQDPKSAAATSAAAPAPPPPPQVRVMVGSITGAPSDGNKQLFSGMRRALGSSKIVVMDKAGPDTFTVVGSASLTPIDDRTTQLSLTWILKDPAGKEVGKVEQANPVPTAATRGSWLGFGDIVAAAAVEGVLELLDKAMGRPH